MSDVYHDPVGDSLRAHDRRMREVRWTGATNIVIALCICAAVVGVAWAIAFAVVRNQPRFSTGFNATGMPWCQSSDERTCPVYSPPGVAVPAR